MTRREALEATRGAADRVMAGVPVLAVVDLPPAYYLSAEEMRRLAFIRWLLTTGRITK